MNADDERSVELVAEGEPAALDELERRLHDGPSGARVEAVVASRQPASGEYAGFGIARG
jgi:acylphosphatase